MGEKGFVQRLYLHLRQFHGCQPVNGPVPALWKACEHDKGWGCSQDLPLQQQQQLLGSAQRGILPWRLEFVPGCFSSTYFLRAVVEQVLGSFMAAMADSMASSIRLPPSRGFSPDFFSCVGQESLTTKSRPQKGDTGGEGGDWVPTWNVPEAPLPVICSNWPFSTALCRAFFSNWGLQERRDNSTIADSHVQQEQQQLIPACPQQPAKNSSHQ